VTRAALFRAETEQRRGGEFSVFLSAGADDDAPRRAGQDALCAFLGRAGQDVRDGGEPCEDFLQRFAHPDGR
jgi:hypothetical protein